MKRSHLRGPIAWMALNPVAANLAMAVLIIGGLITAFRIKKEVFPEFELDTVRITVPYPSASPEEIERGILLAVEEKVRSLDEVKRVTSRAFEGAGVVLAELRLAADREKSLQAIKNAVDRITSFPKEAERPVIQLLSNRRHVISLILYGDVDTRTLHRLGEFAREELLRDPKITLVTVEGVATRRSPSSRSRAFLRRKSASRSPRRTCANITSPAPRWRGSSAKRPLTCPPAASRPTAAKSSCELTNAAPPAWSSATYPSSADPTEPTCDSPTSRR